MSEQIAEHSVIEPYQPAEDEEYMSPGMEAHFREILEAWRAELMSGVDETVGHMKDETELHADPNDRATQESDMGLELRHRDRERKLISKIEKTMRLVDEHEYGYCKTCGIEIGLRRLEARPTADQCIDCKTLAEEKEKQFG